MSYGCISTGWGRYGLNCAVSRWLSALGALAAGGALLVAAPARAQLTRAGVTISNTATASYDDGAGNRTDVQSNTVSLKVDELIDVAVASANSGDVATTPGAALRVLSFRVTNAGNGDENYRLTADAAISGNGFAPTVTLVALDTDGDGAYDPSIDQSYVAGAGDPQIAPESAITVFVIVATPSTLSDGARAAVSLRATATTGSGAAGTVFAGLGTGGGDAVIGATMANQQASGFLRASAAAANIAKSAEVADQFGGASPLPGATITFTLLMTSSGSGDLVNLRIGDTVPAGTSYVAQSITLDGAALTDDADGDAATFLTDRVLVSLGTVTGGARHIVTFKVKID